MCVCLCMCVLLFILQKEGQNLYIAEGVLAGPHNYIKWLFEGKW